MTTASSPPSSSLFDDDDDGWQDMPVVREDEFLTGFDAEDQKKYHYVSPQRHDSVKGAGTSNATGSILDVDDRGNEWRSKLDVNESEYTRLRGTEEDDADEVHLRTKYLFDEDKAMTPLSQMRATKNLLTEAQRMAYVGLCALTCQEMAQKLKSAQRKELALAIQSMELWVMKIMGRLYYHMEVETREQKMIESLAAHGVQAMDLVPPLMTTHTVANPEYDPAEARRQADEKLQQDTDADESPSQASPIPPTPTTATPKAFQTTAKVFQEPVQASMPGVTTSLSAADENITLDIRWTVLCDLFLILIADSVYDARSRVLLENVAFKLGLGWLDVVKFERRVTDALEIQENVEKLENQDVIEGRRKAARKRRYVIMGLATLGGGLVIGLSAGLLAPAIGAGLGAAFTTIGITGTSGFLAGTGGAALITTGGVITGSSIAGTGIARRTQQVKTFEVLPLHNNKRVNCILTVPGLMNGLLDDVRLPFSVLDPTVGDVFSILWEPEMLRETGSALKILTAEVLSQIGQTVLQHTVMYALMSALQWPIIFTKLGYLIDNPWSNALDRAKAAGYILADVLIRRHLGVRPMTLIGFSLGARVIFYALLELAKQKAFGVVQDVFLLGATLTASTKAWCEVRSVVSGRFVNGFARNDWVLNYLFRATSAGLSTVAGLRPIENVPGLENVDVTDKISGHMSYRAFMPLILDQLGFPVSADYFDEPEDPEFTEDRIVVREEDEQPKKKGWFSRSKPAPTPQSVSRPPSAAAFSKCAPRTSTSSAPDAPDADLPPRTEQIGAAETLEQSKGEEVPEQPSATAGFDLEAIKEAIGKADLNVDELKMPRPQRSTVPPVVSPTGRSQSVSRLDDPQSMAYRSSSPSLRVDDGFEERGRRPTQMRSVSLNIPSHEADADGDDDDDQLPPPPVTTFMSPGVGATRHDNVETRDPPTLSLNDASMAFSGADPDSLTAHGAFVPGPSLTFAGSDGVITPGSAPGWGKDPWQMPVNDTKKMNALNSNPWAS